MQATVDKEELQTMMKTTLQEVLRENKEWFIELFQEVLEDYYLGQMIEEGHTGEYVSREEVFAVLNDEE